MFNLQIRKTKSVSALFMKHGRVIKTKSTFCYRLKKNIFSEKSAKSTFTRRMLVPGKILFYVIKRRNISSVSFVHIHNRINKIKKKNKIFRVKKEILKKVSKKYQITKQIIKNLNILAGRIKKNYKECAVILVSQSNTMPRAPQNFQAANQVSLLRISLPSSTNSLAPTSTGSQFVSQGNSLSSAEGNLLLVNGNSLTQNQIFQVTHETSEKTQTITKTPSVSVISKATIPLKISPLSPEKLSEKELRIVLDVKKTFASSPVQTAPKRSTSSLSSTSKDINLIVSNPTVTVKEEPKKSPITPKKAKKIVAIVESPRTRRSKDLIAAQEVKQIDAVYQMNEEKMVPDFNSSRKLLIFLERIDNHPYLKESKIKDEEQDYEEFVYSPEVCPDDPYGCPFCNRVFKREYHLNNHQSTHFSKEELELPKPENEEYKKEEPDSQDEEDIDLDFGNSKMYERRFYCAQIGCNKYYLGTTGIKYHLRKIHPEVHARILQAEVKQENSADGKPKVKEPTYHVYQRGRFKCFICNKPFKSIGNLKKHRIVHSEARPFTCTLCKRTFKEESNLKKHVEIHERQFHCPYCERTFVLESELEEHSKIHPIGTNGEYECHECSMSFAKVKDLSQHKNRVHSETKNFKCETCGEAFKYKLTLLRHERKIHQKPREKDQPGQKQNEWPCDICKKIFSYRCHMIKHKKVHQRAFKCSKCHLSFNIMANLQVHMTMHPNENGEFECEVCGKSFPRRKNWVLHKNRHLQAKTSLSGRESTASKSSHASTGKFQCTICPRTFFQQSHLDNHILLHPEPDGTYKCKICKNSKTFSKINYLKTHLKRHDEGYIEGQRRYALNKGDFPCKICGRLFKYKCFLAAHQKTHQREFKCKLCPKSFNFLNNLQNHEKNHSTNTDGTFPCHLCGKLFLKYSGLRVHLKRHENGTLSSTAGQNYKKTKSYRNSLQVSTETKCKLCGKQFKYNCYLVAHLKTHLRAFKCSLCPRTFNQIINLQEHERCHPDTNGLFKCLLCDKTFLKQIYLKNHQRVHLKQFQCTKCSKSFDHLILLQDHLLTHPESKDGRFACKICEKTFKKLDYLKQHQIVHSDVRKFNCNICRKAFRYATNLKVHIRTHENRPFHCTICPRTFKLEQEFQHHIENHPIRKEKTVSMFKGNKDDFECDFCSKSFENTNQLRRHRLTHSMKRSFKCSICKKSFKLIQHLKNHEMSHSNDRNLKCEICGLTFKFARNIGTHMKFHEKRGDYKPDSAADSPGLPPMPALLAIPGTSKRSEFADFSNLIEIPDFNLDIEPMLVEENLMDVVDLTSD